MAYIKLTQGKIAIIDDVDLPLILQYKWHAVKKNDRYFIARSTSRNRKAIVMHRLIMQPADNMEVDHINGNPLDNRRSNLRIVTHSQNQKNMGIGTKNKSGFKGVSWHKKAKKWQVHLRIGSDRGYIGIFNDLLEAAEAYNKAARLHYGEFARLNVIGY
jgi:hypothetical protein